jgi:hypothetical protein
MAETHLERSVRHLNLDQGDGEAPWCVLFPLWAMKAQTWFIQAKMLSKKTKKTKKPGYDCPVNRQSILYN